MPEARRARWSSRVLWGWVLIVVGHLVLVDVLILDLVLGVHLLDAHHTGARSVAYALLGAACLLAGCLLHLAAREPALLEGPDQE